MSNPENGGGVNAGIFRRYDIRGRAAEDLHDDFVERLGRAYGTRVRQAGGARVALGRDCRASGPRILAAFERGVLAAGVNVLQIGVVPTPVLYFALHHLDVDGGVIITGSHNPPAWNGFKLSLGTSSLHGEDIQDLRRCIEAEAFESGAGHAEPAEILAAYQEVVLARLKTGRPLKVVVDAGNGTGGITGPAVYEALGHEVISLFCEPDGDFPNHHPDPTVEANLAHLKAAVAEHGADVGLAFDGDADRLGAVDGQGRVIWGDQLLLFFAQAILREAPGARVVGEVKCSKVLYEGVAAAGGEAEMWKVGHSLIKARMKETGALIAGEMSGHLFFADRWFGFDDGVYAGGRLLELLSLGEESLAQMLDGLPQTVTTPELRVACPDAEKFAVVDRAVAYFKARYAVCDIDGARIDFPDAWGLIRASNTQPVLVLRFEADDSATLEARRGEVYAWLAEHAPEVDLEADTHH